MKFQIWNLEATLISGDCRENVAQQDSNQLEKGDQLNNIPHFKISVYIVWKKMNDTKWLNKAFSAQM